MGYRHLVLVWCCVTCAASCTSSPAESTRPATAAEEGLPSVASPYDSLPDAVRQHLDDTFTGDGDEMISRRLIRAGVVFNRTQYFIDRGEQRGMVWESLR